MLPVTVPASSPVLATPGTGQRVDASLVALSGAPEGAELIPPIGATQAVREIPDVTARTTRNHVMSLAAPADLPCAEQPEWFTNKRYRRRAAQVCGTCPFVNACLVGALKLDGNLRFAQTSRQGNYWTGIYGLWAGVWFEPGIAPEVYLAGPKPVPVRPVPPAPSPIVLRAVHGSAVIFGVKDADLLGRDRHPDLEVGRGVAMGALRLAGMSLPEIARPFGRHHTTVMYALRRLDEGPGALRACTRQVHDDLQAIA